MHHLFVTQDYAPDLGGMARRHVELCRRIAPERVTVSTVASAGAVDFDGREPYRITRQPFPFASAKRFTNQLAWAGAISTLCREGVDVIHLANIRPCGYAVAIAERLVPTPYLVYVNGGDLLRERQKSESSHLKRWSARDILGRARGVVANSSWTAALAADVMVRVGVLPVPAIAAIDLGTDPVLFHPQRDTGALRRRLGIGSAQLVLTVARLVPHKGQDVAMRAVAALQGDVTGRDLHYLLVGEGDDAARLRALAESLGIANRVHFAGALADHAVAEAYATADAYIGLSRVDNAINAEGFGISFVEASASGTPCVAGDSGGVRAAVREGETGFVVEPHDVEAVTVAMRRLLDDTSLRARMGAAGRLAVESHYNWDRVARETLAFTRRCLQPERDS